MRKRILGIVLAVCLLASMPLAAQAAGDAPVVDDVPFLWEDIPTTAGQIADAMDAVVYRDGMQVPADEYVHTGDEIEYTDDEGHWRSPLVVRGDIVGSGVPSLVQLVQLAGAFTGRVEFTDIQTLAGDFNGNHQIDLGDLVKMAELIRNMQVPDTPQQGTRVMLDSNGNLTVSRPSIGSQPKGEAGLWTVFVYQCGTDLESQGGHATSDLQEMLDASEGGRVRFIVETGGTASWMNDLVDSNAIERWEIVSGEIRKVGALPLASMGDSSTLEDFVKWGLGAYPSERMGFVFWNHGSGSIAGVCFDELHDNSSLSLPEIDSAFAAAVPSMTDKFEFIGFDACLMGTVETANVAASYARYMIGSQESEAGDGWDYRSFGTALEVNPHATGVEVGRAVCDGFYASSEAVGQDSFATLSVLDLGGLDRLLDTFDAYMASLYTALDSDRALGNVIRGIREADNFGGNTEVTGYANMVDMLGVIESGAGYADAAQARQALDDVVLYKISGTDHVGAGGISIYFPIQIQGTEELDMYGRICTSPHYLMVLVDQVLYGAEHGTIEGYNPTRLLGYWTDDSSGVADEYWDQYGQVEPGESTIVEFVDPPTLDDEGTFSFTLTKDSAAKIAGVTAQIVMVPPDADRIIDLGCSATAVAGSLADGRFWDNFDGYWFGLPDGQNLATYPVRSADGYDVYVSLVELNGQRTCLMIAHHSTGEAEIVGAWNGIDENGMSSRDVTPLAEGDVIVPLYDGAMLETGAEVEMRGAEYVCGSDPSEVGFAFLDDGAYLYRFVLEGIFGETYETDIVAFVVEDGEIYFIPADEAMAAVA